jgi:NADH-quinone oxidoreductase subunit M
MVWLKENLLSVIVFFPFFWGLVSFFIPKSLKTIRGYYLLGSFFLFLLCFYLGSIYDPEQKSFQLLQKHPWIPFLGVQFALGVDGLSLPLVCLTGLLAPVVILSSWNSVSEKFFAYYLHFFILLGSILGAFFALDLVLFYFFWEIMLIPLFFIIGIWGGPERVYAALKFFLFTLFGSLLMLVAIAYLMYHHQLQFSSMSAFLPDLMRVKLELNGFFSPQSLVFWAFALAFAIKIPLFPLHTWLPDAHVQAPTACSVILAAILLKMGGFGFLRFCFPLFPQAAKHASFFFMVVSTIAVVYGAALAIVQTDIKKCVAFSSISHMGYVVLGLFSFDVIGMTGAVFQMVSHGVSSAGLFLLVGMLYERRHTREISEFGGIAAVMPIYAVCFVLMTLSSLALPLTNGFVGEFLVLMGSWSKSPFLSGVCATGVVLGAVYLLWLVQRIFYGKVLQEKNQQLKDLSFREVFLLSPLFVLIFLLGVHPHFVLGILSPSLEAIVNLQ